MVCAGLILLTFYLFDRWSYSKVKLRVRANAEELDTLRFDSGINVLLLLVVIGQFFCPTSFL